MKCCGNEQFTAFCPDCGKELNNEPIVEILALVRGKLKTQENVQRRGIEWDKANPGRNDYEIRKRRLANERKIAKFQRWIKALEAMQAKSSKRK
jgi:hypothetical protein